VGRIDLHPELALPIHFDGWSVRPVAGLRETFYSASQSPGLDIPTYRSGSADRKDFEAGVDIRPPAMERDFDAPWLTRLLGSEVRHVIQPEIEYSYVAGVGNFGSILRFDDRDIVSNTNQVRFTLGQRFYFKRPGNAPCTNPAVPLPVSGKIYLPVDYRECAEGSVHAADGSAGPETQTDAWISWDLTGAYFFDQNFGNAVLPFRRNVLSSTLDLSGISFLYGPREYAPVISRLAVHTSRQVQVGWDFDYDTRAGRMNNSNLYASFRHDGFFGSVSEDRLRQLTSQSTAFLSQSAATLAELAAKAAEYTPVTPYNQVQLVIGYGYDTKPGFSVGLNSGYDYQNSQLQYGGAQTTYNWDCCGLTVEYRRLALGSLRNENYESFNFTLAGVGTAGNTNRSTLVY
jgi:LPS-assembly protein